MQEIILELGKKVQAKELTWQKAAVIYYEMTKENISKDALRKRYSTIKDKKVLDNLDLINEKTQPTKSTVEIGKTGTLIEKLVELTEAELLDKELLLSKMVADPQNWEMQKVRVSNWEQHTKSEGTKNLYAVRVELKPKAYEPTPEEVMSLANDLYAKGIKPLKLAKKDNTKANDKLIMCPAIELHLGKLANHIETGENYDYKIASYRFEEIMRELADYQDMYKADSLYIGVGNDFFHSDTTNYTTTKGTPLSNDLRWQKMFLVGLELYTEGLLKLREKFKNIEVHLVAGNHDQMSSFHLYVALQNFFREDNVVKFKDDFKPLQVKVFGDNAIFTHHGDKNYKRLIKSIPNEFYEEWGKTKWRNLFMGHLHHEQMVDEDSGLVARRVGSPSGTDEWHYSERFMGARQQHQLFLFDKHKGLLNSHYIVFEPVKKNDKVKVLK